MSLYTSVYWTKRTLLVVSLLVFICSGFRIFQFVTKKFTTTISSVSDYKPELGFGAIDKLTLTPLNVPPGFKPQEFRNITLNGSFDTSNTYPLESTRSPLANVYKIQEIPIDLNTTETPRRIAKAFGFLKEPVQSTSTTQVWSEGNKDIEINGQYLLIKYKNSALKKQSPTTGDPIVIGESDSMSQYFSEALKSYGIITDFKDYKFTLEYLNFDKAKNEFVFSGDPKSGQFIRLNAIRQYSNLFKSLTTASTIAAYPNYLYSNNYLIFPAVLQKNTLVKDNIVELSLYNWPIGSKEKPDKSIQTYNVKTPKAAFDEVKENNKYLISVADWDTKVPVSLDDLTGINRLQLYKIQLQMYEDVVNTTYIQPVYVFVCQAERNGKLIELVYYVPALTDAVTK